MAVASFTPSTRATSRRRWLKPVAVLGAAGLSLSLLSVLASSPIAPAAAAEPAPTFAADYLDGVTGPQPATSVDLAGTWDFEVVQTTECTGVFPSYPIGPQTCVDTPSDQMTTIQVPGGGWYKQGFTTVSEAIYSRDIAIPDLGTAQATKLHFGAINHEATLSIDGVDVATNMTAFTDSTFDLTHYVEPGETHRIAVDVKGRNALIDPDGYYTVPEAASWSNSVPQGIFRSASLDVYPALHVSDSFVQTSVDDRTLTYDVWVTNSTNTTQMGTLGGDISSASGSDFSYPDVPEQTISVEAGATEKFTVGPLAWQEGEDSYWWPNVPYVEGYKAQLHGLDVDLTVDGEVSESYVRFGFRQIDQVGDGFELNKTPVNFRGDSIQGANFDSIDNFGKGDAVDTLPGFLKPSATNGGWPQVVDNYQRLNMNSVRIHQVPATPYMLDVADEMGLMLMDESAIRGSNGRESLTTGRANMASHVADLVKRDRNHASVLRWSQSNEPTTGKQSPYPAPGYDLAFDELLYKTIMALDTTRPISTDGNVEDLPYDNYTMWCHYVGQDQDGYTDDVCDGLPSPGKPHGSGEHIWPKDSTLQGFMWFATSTERMRSKGAADIRPYTLADGWGSLVPGVTTTNVTLEPDLPSAGGPIFGEDNLPDPWNNHQLIQIQKAYSPLLVADGDYWEANKKSDAAGTFPASPVNLVRGTAVTRTLEVFNDTLDSTEVTVGWELRQGSATGNVVASDNVELDIPAGSDKREPITFTVPETDGDLFLVLESSTPEHGVVFTDDATRFTTAAAAEPTPVPVPTDDPTASASPTPVPPAGSADDAAGVSGDQSLARTGSAAPWLPAGIAALLVAIGAAMIARRRFRTRSTNS